jgi:hypothetical protein
MSTTCSPVTMSAPSSRTAISNVPEIGRVVEWKVRRASARWA